MNKKKDRDQAAELEKKMLLNPEKIEKDNQKNRKRKYIITLVSILAAVCILCISFEAVKAVGKSRLKSKAVVTGQTMETEQTEDILTEEEKTAWQNGWVKYKGNIYSYNEDIMTFLFMGIDKGSEVIEVKEGTDGGQADALFLLVMNPHDKSMKVVGINRNTMADIELYDNKGAYMKTVKAQIAVQHGFGNGMEESCEYQVKAVQRLFYNLPIHGYCAINMGAIETLTDLVGGIELTALEDVKSVYENTNSYVMRKDETKLMDGKTAYSYVRYRDMNESGSADMRLSRQQQFLEEFIKKTKASVLRDITLPVKQYKAVSSQMVTDISVDEVAYLTSVASDYTFDKNQFYSLKGETVMGKQFEEYYADENALYEMILDIFYEPVER